MHTFCQPRRGFTLVELLVVMFLIAVLATLAIAFFPNAASSQTEARAGQLLQSWLTMAKQRAMRDQAPRGVRLWVAPLPPNPQAYYAGATPLANVVTDCQFIEQPPDFPGNPGVTIMSALPPNTTEGFIYTVNGQPVYGATVATDKAAQNSLASPLSCVMFMPPAGGNPAGSTGIITNGQTAVAVPNVSTQIEFWPVQPGDYLEVLGTGLMHQIVQVGVPVVRRGVPAQPQITNHVDFAVVVPPLPYWIGTTANFRIMRAPRVTGDETLKMPDGTIIDLGTNTTFNNPLPWPNTVAAADNGSTMSFVDILFSPTGEVISPGVTSSNLNLWVRTPNTDFPADVFRGAPTIISVFTKTGFVGAYPPNSGTPTMPYSLIH